MVMTEPLRQQEVCSNAACCNLSFSVLGYNQDVFGYMLTRGRVFQSLLTLLKSAMDAKV